MTTSYDPTYPLYPICSFLGLILSIVPLWWHLQAWNAGTCAFMIWTGLACFIGFTNAMVWNGNIDNPSPVWCDISTKIMVGISVGIPAAILCISRRLYCITSATQSASPSSRSTKIRMVAIDLAIAAGIPVLVMVLHVIVQAHRFDIFEDVGCYPVIYNTLASYFIVFMWPIVLGVISFVYSALTLRSFWLRRAQFSQLISSRTSMTPNRYLRLMLLCVIDMMCTIPIGAVSIYSTTNGVKLHPWISWDETHYDFARVLLVRAVVWRNIPRIATSIELTRWLPVFCAFVFFALFGFAAEARNRYAMTLKFCAKPLGLQFPADKKAASAPATSWAKPVKSVPVLANPSPEKGFANRNTTTDLTDASSQRSFELHPVTPITASTRVHHRFDSTDVPFDAEDSQTDTESSFPFSPSSTVIGHGGGKSDVALADHGFKYESKCAAESTTSLQSVESVLSAFPSCPGSTESHTTHTRYAAGVGIAHPTPRAGTLDLSRSSASLRRIACENQDEIARRLRSVVSMPNANGRVHSPVRPAPAFHRPFSPPNPYPEDLLPHPGRSP